MNKCLLNSASIGHLNLCCGICCTWNFLAEWCITHWPCNSCGACDASCTVQILVCALLFYATATSVERCKQDVLFSWIVMFVFLGHFSYIAFLCHMLVLFTMHQIFYYCLLGGHTKAFVITLAVTLFFFTLSPATVPTKCRFHTGTFSWGSIFFFRLQACSEYREEKPSQCVLFPYVSISSFHSVLVTCCYQRSGYTLQGIIGHTYNIMSKLFNVCCIHVHFALLT